MTESDKSVPSCPATVPLDADERARIRALATHSHAVITRHQDDGGAYPASPTFSAYRGYAWLRDGSFTAEGISRYGDIESANRFHDWVDGVLRGRREQVDRLVAAALRGEPPPADEMLPTRYTFDGADGSDPWWDFQTDGYGMWLWSVVTHADRHGVDIGRWRDGIAVAVDYLLSCWDRCCYDWWEEHVEQRHVSTLAAIYGGFTTVAPLLDTRRADAVRSASEDIYDLVREEGIQEGHLTKWLGNSAVDGSLPACIVPFGLIAPDSELAEATLKAVAHDLDVDGGVHRFTADVFYGGGQWILLAALLGWNLAARGDTDGALRHLRWIAAQTNADGDLPEQVDHHLLHPETKAEWVARWGDVASPLLWSHGMYLILADELGLIEQEEP